MDPTRTFVRAAFGCIALRVIVQELRGLVFGTFGVMPFALGILPSVVGASLVVFVAQAAAWPRTRLRPLQATAIAGVVALGYEFAQRVPPLNRFRTFDWADVAATLVGVSAGAVISWRIRRRFDGPVGARPYAGATSTGAGSVM